MRLTKHLFSLFALILVSCECPYQDELDRAQQRKTTGDVFYADVLAFGDLAVLLSHDYWWGGV